MSNVVFATNGHDYTPFVERKSVGWSRNDLDTDQTVRTKDGLMRRFKIGAKRKVSYGIRAGTPTQILMQLDDDLSRTTFEATYKDLHGTQTRTFYCSSFSVTLDEWANGYEEQWSGGAFDIIEI